MNFLFILLNITSVLLISLWIAYKKRHKDSMFMSDEFLFCGNNAILTTSSNVGSLLSVATIFSFYFVGIEGYGFISTIALLLGIIIAYVFLYFCYQNIVNKNICPQKVFIDIDNDDISSYLITFIVPIAYIIVMVLEYSILKEFMSLALGNNDLSVFLFILTISIFCITFITVGGYSGVLWTDIFQLILFIGALIFLIINAPDSLLHKSLGALSAKNFSLNGKLPAFVWVLIAFSYFAAFPDAWVRNFSSLFSMGDKKVKSPIYLIMSFAFIIIALLLITSLTFSSLSNKTHFSYKFDINTTINYYSARFSHIINDSERFYTGWFALGAFLSVFLTTINTWMIGYLQHVSIYKNRKPKLYRLLSNPIYLIVLVTLLGFMVSSKILLYVGLFWFPLGFINILLFLRAAFPRMKNICSTRLLLVAAIAGIFSTGLTEIIWTSCLQENAYLVILLSYVSILTILTPTVFRAWRTS